MTEHRPAGDDDLAAAEVAFSHLAEADLRLLRASGVPDWAISRQGSVDVRALARSGWRITPNSIGAPFAADVLPTLPPKQAYLSVEPDHSEGAS